MTPEDAVRAGGDDAGVDPSLAASLRHLQSLGEGPAPAPSPALAAFLADPTGGAAPAAGWTWMLKEKLAHLSRAGKVVVIAGGIALAGTVSAAAAWQVTSVFPTDAVETPSTVPAPETSTPAHVRPEPTAPTGPDANGTGKDHKDSSASSGKGHSDDGHSDKGKGHSDDTQSGRGEGSGHDGKGDSGEVKGSDKGDSNGSGGSSDGNGSGSGSGSDEGSGSGAGSGDGAGDTPPGDGAGDTPPGDTPPGDVQPGDTPPGDAPGAGSPAAEG